MAMNNIKKHIFWGAMAMSLPLSSFAQSITFDTDDYKAIGVYDSWEESPFRTGELEGNVAVVSNHLNQEDEELGYVVNGTDNILGFQRSRYGSNLFGARIDLNETFELTTTEQYVHVMIHKPTEGRVMLIGLGKRTERAGQSEETEQFWELSTLTMSANEWCDAVFAIKGAGGIDIYSLVVVPDCESPHELTEDYAVYIDEIEINDDSSPRFRRGDYVINFDDDATVDYSGRKFTGITLSGSADGTQTQSWGELSPTPVLYTQLDKSFNVKAGETITPSFSFTGTWMNGYVYLDRGSDGRFDATLNDDYTIPDGSDIMSYSYVETVTNTSGYLSDGSAVSGDARNVLNPPAFTVPSDLSVGYYRMRFKVDWGDIDPGGSSTLISDGGMIYDTRLNIHDDVCNVSTASRNGDVYAEDGSDLNNYKAPYGEAFTIQIVPGEGFTYEGIRVRYGYNLSGDSLVHSTPQYIDVLYPAYLFQDDKFTIPAEIMTADVLIEGLFVEESDATTSDEDYPLNFDESLTISRTDRYLSSFTIAGTSGNETTVTLDTDGENYVYRSMLDTEVPLVPGDEVTTTIDYTGRAMHVYLYLDLNQDGQFYVGLNADGTPTLSGELLSYTYYDGMNSLGETVEASVSSVNSTPEFTLSSVLPTGVYRARLKIDWNNTDPGGQWSESGSNQINDNGGYIVDFLVNVHNETHPLDIQTENGSVNGTDFNGLPPAMTCFEALAVVPTPVADGYEADGMTIRHGHNLDGEQFIHGNRQWSEYTVEAEDYTIPADSVNGDVRITVNYVAGADAEYVLVFSDEFDKDDGSQPDSAKWSRCVRQTSTWNRWLSDSEEVIYIEDGKLVARAIPNPDQVTDDVPMITGGVQTSGNFDFTYGKVEVRTFTNPHTGNFPAIWMMPTDQSDGWPTCGEIDIWEQIDNENTAYHTVHSNWTYNLGYTSNPKSSFNETVQMDGYHTYGLEWDESTITWYVDGQQVGSYAKSSSSSALNRGQWPFDKAFYIILNQSVGNGSWAASADESHTYETLFDWVRIYQKESTVVGIDDVVEESGLNVTASRGAIHISCNRPSDLLVCDAAGRVVWKGTVSQSRDLKVSKGIYVVGNQKILVP